MDLGNEGSLTISKCLYFIFFHFKVYLIAISFYKGFFLKYFQIFPLIFVLFKISVCIYQSPLRPTGCDTKSVFKQKTASLDSEFSFSHIDYFIQAKETNLLYYLYMTKR